MRPQHKAAVLKVNGVPKYRIHTQEEEEEAHKLQQLEFVARSPRCGPVPAYPGLTTSHSEVHRLVYQEIERSARKGIWTRDLKRATSLQQVGHTRGPAVPAARHP